MRALIATVLFLLMNLQPLAGAALCLRHHATQDGMACVAAMEGDARDSGHMHVQTDALASGGEMPPVADECAAALACAAPAPVVSGASLAFSLAAQLLFSETLPPVAHRPDAPATPFFVAGAIGLAGTALFVATVEERYAA